MKPTNYELAYKDSQESALSLIERYYLNFIYGSYNKKRIIFNDFSGDGEKNIVFFGDSHLITFEHVFLNRLDTFANIYSRRFHGLTLYGINLDKYSSRFDVLLQSLKKIRADRFVLCLGEVDCRNAANLICDKYGLGPHSYSDIIEENLITFINTINNKFECEVLLTSIPEPVYCDLSIWTKKSGDIDRILSFNKELNSRIHIVANKFANVSVLELMKHTNKDDYMFKGDHHIGERPVRQALREKSLI